MLRPLPNWKPPAACESARGANVPPMDKRVFLLLVAAVFIGGLCAFKATRRFLPQTAVAPRPLAEPAPPIELYDQSAPSRIVRLESYLGRQRVIVVFFDGREGAHASRVLNYLKDNWGRLRAADIHVLAVSTALPQENRKEIARYGPYPFPLLSDPDLHVHRAWDCLDEARRAAHPGVFIVDRKGWVRWSRETDAPEPAGNWQAAVEGLIAANEI